MAAKLLLKVEGLSLQVGTRNIGFWEALLGRGTETCSSQEPFQPGRVYGT